MTRPGLNMYAFAQNAIENLLSRGHLLLTKKARPVVDAKTKKKFAIITKYHQEQSLASGKPSISIIHKRGIDIFASVIGAKASIQFQLLT
jgi:hypothetical protein